MAQCTDGSARWNLNPCDCSVYGGGDDIVRDCQMVHAVYVFVMSYFVVGQAYNTTLVVGTFRSGGDTQFWIDTGYVHHVGLFDLVWSTCCICISL